MCIIKASAHRYLQVGTAEEEEVCDIVAVVAVPDPSDDLVTLPEPPAEVLTIVLVRSTE
jgi:hypothetical protein